MAEKVEFELVSPEELLISQPVDMVVVPGGEGYYGVLAGHVPMITTVRPGAITTYEDNRITDRIFVSGGFAEVTDERVTVLVEGAMKVSSLDKSKVEQDIKNFGEDVEDAKSDDERIKAERNLAVAQAQLVAIQDAAASH
ncbi:MAG: F0F1 ATP synthase subunit epsilon [Rhodospirillaceae bacterium]